MSWLGKLIGGAIGFALGGPVGAIAGAVFGHGFDMDGDLRDEDRQSVLSQNEQIQMVFFVAVFSMLAKMAKADGRICESEIETIERFMTDDLQLNADSRRIATTIFKTASNSDDPFEGFAGQFYNQFSTQPRFLEIMLDILLRVSTADGQFHESEENLLLSAVRIFHYPMDDYLKLKARYVGKTDVYLSILGCDRNDSNDLIKSQYRKLVQEYHPDKIASKGLPEEFSKFAADKFREIQEAYEIVKKERGIV
jgi:DnaJ like chaperone protein